MKSPRDKKWFLKAGHSLIGRGGSMQLLSEWRKAIGYYSILAAVPALMSGSSQDVRADDAAVNSPPAPPDTGTLARRGTAGREFWRTRGGKFPRHSDNALLGAETLNSADDCPGTPIPAGSYTPASRYIDIGNTTGANDTVTGLSVGGYGYWYYYDSLGPDRIYSFDLTSLGAIPQVSVTTSSPSYQPMIYLVDGCPAGQGNVIGDGIWGISDSRWHPGNTTADLSLNLATGRRYYLFVDSSMAAEGGAYTLTLSGVRIGVAPPIPANLPDFDGDGRSDVSVFRPSDGNWYVQRSGGSGVAITNWGNSTDVPVPGDYDKDGKTDVAVYRPSTGMWFIVRSSDSAISMANWGTVGDIPVARDYDADGKTDFAVFRPSTGDWYVYRSSDSQVSMYQWGNSTDLLVPADYDGDGKTDVAVYRPSTGIWYVYRSTGGPLFAAWGTAGDKPVPADYDGDGATDFAIYRPSDGNWYIYRSSDNQVSINHWGNSTDIPVPGDYDGDHRADVAVYRTGTWYVYRSSQGLMIAPNWGNSTDIPIPARYIP